MRILDANRIWTMRTSHLLKHSAKEGPKYGGFMSQKPSCFEIWGTYPWVIKHGNGKSHVNGGFNGKIIHEWWIFQHAMFDDTGGYEKKLKWGWGISRAKLLDQAVKCDIIGIGWNWWADRDTMTRDLTGLVANETDLVGGLEHFLFSIYWE